MTLSELIEELKKHDPKLVVLHGFDTPHSYRGFYDQLAFAPAENVTVGSMLSDARWALGKTFTGWKGGEFVMGGYVDVWLAEVGCCGEGIGPTLLAYMFADAKQAADLTTPSARGIQEAIEQGGRGRED